MEHKSNRYDDFASQYAELVAAREEAGIEHDPIMPRFLTLLGDVSSLLTLDAGCGEGYVSRILARHGAQGHRDRYRCVSHRDRSCERSSRQHCLPGG